MDEDALDARTRRMAPVLNRIPEAWGRYLSYGSGWDSLILALDSHLAQLAPAYEIHQVKEKFGTLRFYADHGLEHGSAGARRFEALIREAEEASLNTCQECGVYSASVGMARSLCPACAVKFRRERRQ